MCNTTNEAHRGEPNGPDASHRGLLLGTHLPPFASKSAMCNSLPTERLFVKDVYFARLAYVSGCVKSDDWCL